MKRIMRSGREVILNSEGGRGYLPPVPCKALESTKNALIEAISNGGTLTGFLRNNALKYTDYVEWCRKDVGFRQMVETARSSRASILHEEFTERNIIPLSKVTPMELDNKANTLLAQRISVVEKLQAVFSKHKAEEDPARFGPKKDLTLGMGNVTINADIPEEQFKQLLALYTPKKGKDGGIEIPDKDIVLAEYTEKHKPSPVKPTPKPVQMKRRR